MVYKLLILVFLFGIKIGFTNVIYDKNEKPVAAIQHEDGRDNYSDW